MNAILEEQIAQMSQPELGALVEALLQRLQSPAGSHLDMAELERRAQRVTASPEQTTSWDQMEAELFK